MLKSVPHLQTYKKLNMMIGFTKILFPYSIKGSGLHIKNCTFLYWNDRPADFPLTN